MPPTESPSKLRSSAVAAFSVFSLISLAGTGMGCSSTDTSAPVAPAGPTGFGITDISLLPAGAGSASTPEEAGACIELGRDPRKTITVRVEDPKHRGTIKNWTFAAPFACGDTVQCGYLLVTVDPGPHAVTIAAVAVSVDIPMAELQAPEGPHEIIVELWNANRTIARDGSGTPQRLRLTIQAKSSCGGAGTADGGLDGTAPPSKDSGAPDGARDGAGAPPPDAMAPDGQQPDASIGDASARSDGAVPPPPGDAAVHDAQGTPDSAPADASHRD